MSVSRIGEKLGSLSNDNGDVNENGKKTKKKRFRLTKQQLCKCITLFCTFLCLHGTTTTWKYLISRLVEDLKTRQRLYFSFPELLYSLLEFNSEKKFANIWRIERNGIYKGDYVSNRGPPFDFKFSDVFVAVAVLVISLPINRSKAWKFYLLFLFQNCWTLQGLEPAVVTSRLVTIFACYRCSVSTHLTDNALKPSDVQGECKCHPSPRHRRGFSEFFPTQLNIGGWIFQ